MKKRSRKWLQYVLALGLGFLLVLGSIALAAPGDIERVSLFDGDEGLEEGNGNSVKASISGDGRYVAFEFKEGGFYGRERVYVHDRELHTTFDIPLDYPYNAGAKLSPDISADGEYLAFVRFYTPEEAPREVQILVVEWLVEDGDLIPIEPPVEGGFPGNPSISGDGCRVAFDVRYTDDDEENYDIYVYDCLEGTSTLISNAYGTTDSGNGNSNYPAISDNGLFVTFSSYATNLVPDPVAGGYRHIYVRDLETGATDMVPLPEEYEDKNGHSYGSSISADGRFVAFDFGYEEEDNYYYVVFVHDRQTGLTSLVSLIGDLPSDDSENPSISGDGRFVSFETYHQDENEDWYCDIFVHDRLRGETKLVSRGYDGTQANDYSTDSAISADGRFIAFESYASNLVDDDTNDYQDIFVYENETAAFNKTTPAGGATGVSLDPTLSWETSAGATGYEYCYDTTNDDACSNWTSTGTETSASLSGLSPETSYYWHVRATNSYGITYAGSSETGFWSFSTITEAVNFQVFVPLVTR
jgi:Tol biopolymer transport system component